MYVPVRARCGTVADVKTVSLGFEFFHFVLFSYTCLSMRTVLFNKASSNDSLREPISTEVC